MIGLIDYDAGNIRSVEKAFAYLGEETVVSRDPEVLLKADKVVLPGVGSFGEAMENLHSEIETDEKWLLFILEQLLSNAVKYTQKGGTVKIYEKETLLKSDTVLVIEDNGIGIQSEDLPRIMERGYTGYNGRGASKSSGIGLYLCKKAADQLGIDIEVESEPYHGTKVLLTIRQHHTRHE